VLLDAFRGCRDLRFGRDNNVIVVIDINIVVNIVIDINIVIYIDIFIFRRLVCDLWFRRNNNVIVIIVRRVFRRLVQVLLIACFDDLGDRLLPPSTIRHYCNHISCLPIAHLLNECYDLGAVTKRPCVTASPCYSSVEVVNIHSSLFEWVPLFQA